MSAVVTYAHKRRRIQNASKKPLPSSPLEVLPPDVDNLTRTQMARRMLKRSRRVALAEQVEDKNIREHLARRIKCNQECTPFDVAPPDDVTLQTPFPSQSVRESIGDKSLVPEPLSPGPAVNRVLSPSRTSSKNLKENTLASPFNSRPGSAAASPARKGRGRPSRRLFPLSLHAKSRTVSGVFKENSRRVLRKDSTSSLKDMHRKSSTRPVKHQRYPSNPSSSYMRPQLAQEGRIAPLKVFSHTRGSSDIPLFSYTLDDEEVPSPGPSVRSSGSFYADQPRFCSTPAISRLRKVPDLHGYQTRNDDLCASLGPSGADNQDVEMMDGTVPARRQTTHLSKNSIFSSSDDFTIRSLTAKHAVGRDTERDLTHSCDGHQVPARERHDESPTGHSLTRSFVVEYDIPLAGSSCSPASTTATNFGENITHLSRSGVPKSSVAEQSLGLPGTSPACAFGYKIGTTCPSSPMSDLVPELQSVHIRDDPDGKETRRPSAISLQVGLRSLHEALSGSSVRGSTRRKPARNRASTIRASDFSKPSILPSGAASGSTIPPSSNVRRTRSGTVVGSNSKVATKATLPTQVARGPASKLAAVPSGSESESDDELLLKSFWTDDLVFLGVPVPLDRQEAEADELNLGGKWHGLESGPPCQPRSRKR